MNAFILYQSHWKVLLKMSLFLSSSFLINVYDIFLQVQTMPNFMLCPMQDSGTYSMVIHLKNIDQGGHKKEF